MKTKEFSFDLPQDLIALNPPEQRGTSRLMVLNPKQTSWSHQTVPQIMDLVAPGTLMVFNNSKVRKARLQVKSASGGSFEALVLESGASTALWKCLFNKSKKLKKGQVLSFPEGFMGEILDEAGATRWVRFNQPLSEDFFDRHGDIPLPPYIQRPPQQEDLQRYQTVYAASVGSAAAPTAGLHFTQALLEALEARGIFLDFVTLHVGLGTFLPVRSEHIDDHEMHTEHFFLSPATANRILSVREGQGKVLAVGTTTVRTLESAWKGQEFQTGWQSTNIFIKPGYKFQVVDQLFTNFHTPESTLLMLVSAFAGWDFIKRAYEEAIRERYRFFSYGDSMLITCSKD